MRAARSLSTSTETVAALMASLSPGMDEPQWRESFREHFDALLLELDLHPEDSGPGATFEHAADSARRVAAQCLPLGIALVMHLYPLCALKCVPLPWWSPGNLRRNRLLRDIQEGGLVLANAGGERTSGVAAPVVVSRTHDGILVNGTFDYVSLANVADLALFSADHAGQTVFCAADLHGESVRIGAGRFSGSMRLSDTCPLSFVDHFLPADRFITIPTESARHCMSQYQRSWFHLLLGEAHLARIEYLYQCWDLPRPPELLASLNELAFLRKYALCLLEEASTPGSVDSLSRVTATMKLRISMLAQTTAAAIRSRDESAAIELGFIRRQPTCDEKILQSLRTVDAGLPPLAESRACAVNRPSITKLVNG